MKSLCAAALLLAFGSFGFAQKQSTQKQNTWDGYVTDTHCGTHCQRASGMAPDRACVRRCVRHGSKYALWHGNHVYVLEPQPKAADFAAEKVRVTGDLSNDTIHIRYIVRIPQQTP